MAELGASSLVVVVRHLMGPCRLVKDEYFYFVCLCVYVCAQVSVQAGRGCQSSWRWGGA